MCATGPERDLGSAALLSGTNCGRAVRVDELNAPQARRETQDYEAIVAAFGIRRPQQSRRRDPISLLQRLISFVG